MKNATTPAALIEALQSLRESLASTSAPLPYGIAYIRDTREFPQVAAVKRAAAAVRAVWPDPDQGTLEENSPPLIAPRRLLQDIGRFLRDDIGQLDRLPAPPSIQRKLDEIIGDLGGRRAKRTSIVLQPAQTSILERLADARPGTVTQEKLTTTCKTAEGKTLFLSGPTVHNHIYALKKKRLVRQPDGPKKGWTITADGLSLIGRP